MILCNAITSKMFQNITIPVTIGTHKFRWNNLKSLNIMCGNNISYANFVQNCFTRTQKDKNNVESQILSCESNIETLPYRL